ncbi:MBL fold metallo-hydrolase [Paractinoplanes abujensis]|uniref:L-ascorbate metabolism protein UlaG (Beta-lactamase superfamily) n=1 Tax=Paractinoplanes abujensis TaxID=882441 RepID=A0A7W7G7A1_9ACTN|nr:MBL fold metallo-hydrolase [Actinoplanes abujensis]MBB4696761.1 L-ascorbate metabolism protein UlaG (beta-lactamase superfamily) [Actinoplanes abujensis]GID18775.1 MBL fold metallo-hydrolase [Actinoplanes abujensis]
MQITKFTHSCLRVEGAGVLVVDPGAFSERSALDGADAVLITHEHFDHLDPEALAETLAQRPELRLFAHADVLAQHPRFAEVSTAVEPGAQFEAAGYRVRVFGGQHAVIHPDIPRIANVGYLIADESTNLYHPGDSFTVPEDTTVDTLFAPLNAPWMKLSESIDFVRAVRPGRAYALHDYLLTETGAKVSDGHLERLSGTKYAHVAPGTTIA